LFKALIFQKMADFCLSARAASDPMRTVTVSRTPRLHFL